MYLKIQILPITAKLYLLFILYFELISNSSDDTILLDRNVLLDLHKVKSQLSFLI